MNWINNFVSFLTSGIYINTTKMTCLPILAIVVRRGNK